MNWPEAFVDIAFKASVVAWFGVLWKRLKERDERDEGRGELSEEDEDEDDAKSPAGGPYRTPAVSAPAEDPSTVSTTPENEIARGMEIVNDRFRDGEISPVDYRIALDAIMTAAERYKDLNG